MRVFHHTRHDFSSLDMVATCTTRKVSYRDPDGNQVGLRGAPIAD
jgi:hypothetical protein